MVLRKPAAYVRKPVVSITNIYPPDLGHIVDFPQHEYSRPVVSTLLSRQRKATLRGVTAKEMSRHEFVCA